MSFFFFLKWHTVDIEVVFRCKRETGTKVKNIYVIFIQVRHYMIKNNLICASDAVTYAVFTEL